MKLAERLAEDRRLVILRCLTEVGGLTANEAVLRTGLDTVGHVVARDQVRQDMQFLADAGLIDLETLAMPSGPLWLGRLTAAGQDVAEGRRHVPGVARRRAE